MGEAKRKRLAKLQARKEPGVLRKLWHWFLDEVLNRCPTCKSKMGVAVFGDIKTPRVFCSWECLR